MPVSTLEIDHPSLELAPIGEWRLLCAFPRGHPLEAKTRLSLGDVLRYRGNIPQRPYNRRESRAPQQPMRV